MSHDQKPKPTIERAGRDTIRSPGRLHCSCGRILQAADVEVRDDGIFVICQGCHKDLLAVDREG
jgi:hypothetical protein